MGINPALLPINFENIRIAFAREIQRICQLDASRVQLAEPESQDWVRPARPYFTFKFTTPAAKSGDDFRQNVLDNTQNPPVPTETWNSGGVRKMTVSFNCMGETHEEAYNLMALWQAQLDTPNVQEDLRRAGIAVWLIGNVADLSQLLETGYEGRSQMECTFGVAANITQVLGEMDSVEVKGKITDGVTVISTDITAPE